MSLSADRSAHALSPSDRLISTVARCLEPDTAHAPKKGASVNKRIRLLTYPSLLSWRRKEPCDFSKRVRSSSLNFSPSAQAFPRVKVKDALLRPASLAAPEPRSSHAVPCITQVGLNADGDLSRVVIGFPSSASDREQAMFPQKSRNLSQTTSQNATVTESTQFVFGENMSERVLSPPCNEDKSETDSNSSDSDSSCTEATYTVMRHQGSLKLILNTKLYPHTHLRRPARRNLQVTATDLETHSVRVFLVQASARDIARLYVAIHHRLVALRCSTAMLWDKEGQCSSEEDNNEEEKANEETVLITNKRSYFNL
ncbi:Ran-binding protein 3-like [Bagarius yarrelli]|uniref:Ran-binding protein 3-like n=1 Tax=Bagarius yarrelli TaxID=175774 RepID=A0A556U3G8_BAGYA|nr:Ran-binding protein 3-like [Bagarius yarrelli]